MEGIFVRSSRQSYPVAVEISFPLAKVAHFHQGDQGKHKDKFILELTGTCVSEEFLKALCLQSSTLSSLEFFSFFALLLFSHLFIVACFIVLFFF